MLDNEPDAEQTTTPAEQAPPAPRRRRAASRPAGPPTSRAAAPTPDPSDVPPGGLEPATSASPDPVSDPVADRLDALLSQAGDVTTADAVEDEPTAPEPAAPEPAAPEPAAPEPEVKPARRRTRKAVAPAAEDAAPAAAPVAETDAEPPARPTRRRTRKAVAAPAAETDADDLVAEADQPAAPAAEEAPAAGVVTAPVDEQPVQADDAAASEEQVDEESEQAGVSALAALVDEAGTVDAALAADADADAAPDADADEPSDEDDDAEPSDEDDEDAENDSDSSDSADEGGDANRRRRRRRGGRRRRRTGDSDGAEGAEETTDEDGSAPAPEAAEQAESGEPAATADNAEDESGDDSSEDSDGNRRRRRRRRRRGEETVPAPDDPTDVVVRVREPRKSARSEKSAEDQVTGISGSTRMEAKRQRRREGREAGRRRAPILSEAEFLARREAVTRRMIIRQRQDSAGDTLTQIAVLEDDILVEHYVDRESATSLIGNVYLGRVQNVLPSMEAAFVDIGRGRNAVIYAGEVDWDSFGAQGQNRKVEKVLKSGQTVLVQVTKDPVGAKGARLTNHVSIPGRYIVYAPSGHLSGISRKLPENERKRLKDILSGLVGEASVIVRTAAEGASEEELVRDVNRLKAQWSDIEAKVAKGQAPQLLYGEPDLTVRIVRDLFTEDFSELIVSGQSGPDDVYDSIDAYVKHVAPHLADRLKHYEPGPGDDTDVFARYRIDEQIAKALERKVFLPSGGSLVIDRTEAMTVIDVNTGKFTGSGGNLEATVTSNNLEAAEEIVRQLRLRDVGGIIVIDFIDMVLPANRELLLRRLVECLGRDRTRHQVAEVTSLGLVQMTRKKIGTGLLEAFGTECPTCHGRGYEIHDEPVESQRQADGGAREQRGSRRGGGNGSSGVGNGHQHDHGSHDASGNGAGGSGGNGSGRSGRSRGGRGRRGGEDSTPEETGTPSGAADPAIRAAVQHAIAEVAAGSRASVDEAVAAAFDGAPTDVLVQDADAAAEVVADEPTVEAPAKELAEPEAAPEPLPDLVAVDDEASS
ncbi:Rne/Rng family ribonuclease [Microlunatus flavus]|uniref:Ribonuclease E n=1 Tax=Microlunatus flavus TaxID=1036181 RepID=A0A1H9D0E2_9ACTN|nr:Rne/Rng family ribonuclease [Microlunatus flavus]SEQ06837.1 ribonuclease E [Microlunatus flavus]